MQQCTELTAKIDCQFNTTKGRPWKVKAMQKFWVTSPTYNNADGCMIDRKGKGSPNSGIYLTLEQISQVFYVLCLIFVMSVLEDYGVIIVNR